MYGWWAAGEGAAHVVPGVDVHPLVQEAQEGGAVSVPKCGNKVAQPSASWLSPITASDSDVLIQIVPRAPASLGQSAAWAALAGHTALAFHVAPCLAVLQSSLPFDPGGGGSGRCSSRRTRSAARRRRIIIPDMMRWR